MAREEGDASMQRWPLFLVGGLMVSRIVLKLFQLNELSKINDILSDMLSQCDSIGLSSGYPEEGLMFNELSFSHSFMVAGIVGLLTCMCSTLFKLTQTEKPAADAEVEPEPVGQVGLTEVKKASCDNLLLCVSSA
jgi:hypothetical protein